MKRILLLACIILSVETLAQDLQFSQFYQAPLYLNPGFTGITQQQRLVMNHRLQWPSLPQAFATYAMSYDIFVDELHSGFGLLVTTDKMGSAGWRTTTVGGLYSYKVKLTKKLVFSPGLYFGYGSNGIDRSKIRLGDGLQYPRSDGTYNSLDTDQAKLGNQSYFDVGAGFLMYTRTLWLGASFQHMNKPNISVLGDESRLPMKTSIHGGMRITLGAGGLMRQNTRMSYLTPSFIYRTQGATFTQLDLGLNYHIDPVSVGVWYRGKPFQKSVVNSISQDALILQLGMYFKNLSIGYSYDFTISALQTATGGAHEISIIYEFASKPLNRAVKHKYRLIPCPTFNSKENFWN